MEASYRSFDQVGDRYTASEIQMQYLQLIQKSTHPKQSVSHSYPPLFDSPPPTSGSMDSGYAGEDINPFEKGVQYQAFNDFDFGQGCPLQSYGSTNMNPSLPFNYVLSNQIPQGSDGNPFTSVNYVAPYQGNLNSMNQFQGETLTAQPPSLPMEDSLSIKSEDGLLDRMCSKSSPQTSSTVCESPLQQPSWALQRPVALKRRATDIPTDTKRAKHDEPMATERSGRGRPRKRIPHTAVERRYRENLNMHLDSLRAVVPHLQASQRRRSTDGPDILKPSKCEVLMGAVEYIKRLETENERLKNGVSEDDD